MVLPGLYGQDQGMCVSRSSSRLNRAKLPIAVGTETGNLQSLVAKTSKGKAYTLRRISCHKCSRRARAGVREREGRKEELHPIPAPKAVREKTEWGGKGERERGGDM